MQDQGSTTHTPGPSRLLAGPSAYLSLCWAPALLVLMYVGLALSGQVRMGELLLVIGFLAVMLYVVRSYGIELSPEGIAYRKPFSRRGSVRWSNIRAVHVGVNLRRVRKVPMHFIRIDLGDTVTPFFMNIRPFGPQNLAHLVRTIRETAPHAALSPAAERMMAGTMPTSLSAPGDFDAPGVRDVAPRRSPGSRSSR